MKTTAEVVKCRQLFCQRHRRPQQKRGLLCRLLNRNRLCLATVNERIKLAMTRHAVINIDTRGLTGIGVRLKPFAIWIWPCTFQSRPTFATRRPSLVTFCCKLRHCRMQHRHVARRSLRLIRHHPRMSYRKKPIQGHVDGSKPDPCLNAAIRPTSR